MVKKDKPTPKRKKSFGYNRKIGYGHPTTHSKKMRKKRR